MSKPKVFVARLIPDAGLDKVRAACAADIWSEPLPPPAEVLRERIAQCDGLLALLTDRIDGAVMDAAPRLKVISNYAVGFNNIDIPAATERGILVGNTPGVLTDSTADMAFALLIVAARRIVESVRYATDGHWKTWEPLGHIGQDLTGRTIGIVGMGRIGLAMARRCYGGWGMKVIYHSPRNNAEADRDLNAERVELPRLLAESDFISVHTNLNDTTRGMFNAQAFRQMKPTCVFVNTSRGPLVVEADLERALREGWIFSAGLDVTDPEPPPMDSPLFSVPNCVVAPHIASATVTSRNAMADIAADNLIAGVTGNPLRHCVNPEAAQNAGKR